jgi:DNA (cytosine-5)-methyltransferase 1
MQDSYIDWSAYKPPKKKRTQKDPPRRTKQGLLRVGSLCTGYGGLDMAVRQIFGAAIAWVADNDRHVRTLLATHHPDIPNLGDISAIDWHQIEPVDVLCAGFPCQDISFAGRGAGIAHCVGDA